MLLSHSNPWLHILPLNTFPNDEFQYVEKLLALIHNKVMTLHLILLNFYSYYASPQGHPNYSSTVVSSQFSLALKMPQQVTRESLTWDQSSAPSPSGAALVCIHPGVPFPLRYQVWLPPSLPSPHTVLVSIPISVLWSMLQDSLLWWSPERLHLL